MGKRLSTKHRKSRRDSDRAYAESTKQRWDHKVATARSTKALKKKAYVMT